MIWLVAMGLKNRLFNFIEPFGLELIDAIETKTELSTQEILEKAFSPGSVLLQ